MSEHTPMQRMPGASEGSASPEQAPGRLSRTALVSLSLASYIPAVSFAMVPFLVFTTSGTSAWQASLLATIAVICIGRAVIVFARRYTASGSLYSYVGEAFGPWARYLTAASLFAGFVMAIAALAAVVGVFVGSFLYARGFHAALQFNTQVIIFGIALLIAVVVALRGLDTSVHVAVTLAVLALPLVVAITIGSALHTGLDLSHQFNFSGFSISHVLQGVAVGAAFLVGFESCSSLATETRDPHRSVPMAVMSVPVILGGLFPVVTILQVPGLTAASDQLAAGVSAPAALAIQAGFGTTVASATDVVLAVSAFASLIGFVNYGARFAMTLAADRLLPAPIARLHPRHGSPHIAIVVMSSLSFLTIAGMLLWTGDIVSAYTPNSTLLVYMWVMPYILICAGAVGLTLRLREFRPTLWTAAAVGAATMVWTYVNGIINPPPAPADSMTWVAGLAILAVLVVFLVNVRTAKRTPASASDGASGPHVPQPT